MIAITLYALTAFAVFLGVGVAIWSFLDTRRRFYNEYVERQRK